MYSNGLRYLNKSLFVLNVRFTSCHLDIHWYAAHNMIMYVTIKSLTMFMSHFLISLIHLDHLDLMKLPGDRT